MDGFSDLQVIIMNYSGAVCGIISASEKPMTGQAGLSPARKVKAVQMKISSRIRFNHYFARHTSGASGRLFPIIMLAGLVFLASCAVAPQPPVEPEKPAITAEQAFSAGDYAQAARLWQKQALSTSEAGAGSVRLKAADAWLLAEQPAKAEDNLRWVDKQELAPPDQARMNLVLADLALRADRPGEAEQLLQEAEVNLPDSARERFTQLQANTTQMLSRPGSRDISQAMSLVESSTSYNPEQSLALLQALEIVPSSELQIRSQNPRGNQVIVGWLDLTWVIRQNLVYANNLGDAVTAWKGRHPYHPVNEEEALDLWLRYRQTFTAPETVAILLPGSGRLQVAADAIRDGFLSAYLDNPGNTKVFFLSTGEEGELAHSAYFEALDLGADWIVGPLQKQSIEALLGLAGLVTPVLALNELPEGILPPAGMAGQTFGVSLSQDKETQAIAQEAAASGFKSAIILAPESEWGERMAQTFQDEFLQKNGKIVASSRYLESENDHSATLERLLKLDESKARKNQLENTLQMDLEFDPIRRTDVDVIFLAANSTQGRSIRPQLRFHYAGDIPVFATGRIFSGRPDPARDQDLNGIIIPIAPLMLEPGNVGLADEFASTRGGAFSSLYALGLDSWNLLPWLELMKRDPDFYFPGASGYYSEGEAGNLDRQPAFAIFKGGVPLALSPADDLRK